MFHKVIINNYNREKPAHDFNAVIKLDGNFILQEVDGQRDFCRVTLDGIKYYILGTLDELMDKFNSGIKQETTDSILKGAVNGFLCATCKKNNESGNCVTCNGRVEWVKVGY